MGCRGGCIDRQLSSLNEQDSAKNSRLTGSGKTILSPQNQMRLHHQQLVDFLFWDLSAEICLEFHLKLAQYPYTR